MGDEMHQLNELESNIYELIRSGIQPKEISKRQEYRQRKNTMMSVVGRLTKMGFLEKIKLNRSAVRYIPRIEHYTMIKEKKRKRDQVINIKLSVTRFEFEPFSKVEVTKTMSDMIYELSKLGMSRQGIALQLNLPRYLVNRERIARGVDTKI